jgi:chromosome segregation ATPase
MEGAAALQVQSEEAHAKLTTALAELAAVTCASPPTTELSADAADDGGSERMRARLATIRSEKRELETQVDELTSQVRKLERESKRNEGGLRAELDALREAYDKLRARRNRQAGVTADGTDA